MKLRKGDNVLVISGKDKNRKGKILEVFPGGGKIVVEGMNLRKKHRKPKGQGQKGEVIEVTAPLDVSNVKVLCTKCTKPVRIGYKKTADKKYRICKKCGEEI